MKKDKKIISWAMYDWANSAFATTVMSGFFPIFFKEYWSHGTDPTVTTARLGTVISIAGLTMAMSAPFLGAVADHRGHKKLFVFLFMLVAAMATGFMFFIPMGNWLMAAVAYGLAMMAFYASCVFYDSLLPYVAQGKAANEASALGFGMGYLGGGILFLLNVLMYLKPHWFGIPDGTTAVRIAFASVAIWWIVFSLPLFKNVPEPKALNKTPLSKVAGEAFRSVWKTLMEVKQQKNLFTFLLAYWLYIDGVYTVITMAVDYGKSLNFASSDLISALLITQFVGFPFSILAGKVSHRWGCKKPILFAIGVYTLTVIWATQMTSSKEFYILAGIIGMVQGCVQALSRGLFANMIPKDASAEYFGFFNLVGKFASILGPIIVGFGALFTGSNRLGMLGLIVLFILGGILLMRVKEPTGAEAIAGANRH